MADQAERLRQLVRESRSAARTVAVTSGKGGVGKTNMSLNLGILLSAMGERVIVLDADLGLANIDVICEVQARYNLAHVLAGKKTLAEIVVPGPGGVRIVPGASGITQLADASDADRQRLLDQLQQLERTCDTMIIDTAAGIGHNVTDFAASADVVLVVTTPEPTAITDAYAVIKVLTRDDDYPEMRCVVNMAASRKEATEVLERMTGAARQFLGAYVQPAGEVLHDQHVPMAVRRRQPFVMEFPGCDAAICLRRLAGSLAVRQPTLGPKRGFFRRLFGRWTRRAG